MSRKKAADRAKETKVRTSWLSAGAVTLGVGAALASGSPVAHADTPHSGASTPSTSVGHDTGPATGAQTGYAYRTHPRVGTSAKPQTGVTIRRASSLGSTATTGTGSAAAVVTPTLKTSPLTNPSPLVPDQPPLVSALALVRREIGYTLFNKPPTVRPEEVSESATGVIIGDLHVTDATGAPVTYTVTQRPTEGTVVVNPDGSYTYTPNPDANAAGAASDQFSVRVNDGAAERLPGVAGLIQSAFHSVARWIGLAGADSSIVVVPISQLPVTVDPTVTKIIAVGKGPNGEALSPNGSTLYVANATSNTVSVINTATGTVTKTINVGQEPLATAVSPNGATVYVANDNSNTVSVINTATGTVTKTITVGNKPSEVALSPNGSTLYVGNTYSGTVSVINTATNTVTKTITVGASPAGMAISPNGGTVYVANSNGGTVSVINTATNTVTETITVADPLGVAVSPNGKYIYVTNYDNGDTVSVISAATNTITATIPLNGNAAFLVAVSPDSSTIYVTSLYGNDTISMINAATNTVTTTIPVGVLPYEAAISPDGSTVYVTNATSNTVSVISVF
ncbi:beta-propeller fold lactonase family protein [Mycolicibacterium sphagni]|uniref:YNCE-like beta-propeller domain-containing protein n=1 Tax=Mycolicibacterium sphagni TaxID=1786 RepID=A0A255DA87_9MYCO|nr:beta-propeller fold lactonase family protein [Mycolicibacterium sphagni]OYN75541.1 hypothetical protein CG716_25355 [Mycolicibacterium sphagni]